ncbi:MAG: hypothetical protein JXK07_13470 [Spirochaetes bacterium]|nr:hypothetical protein [Spirochaetota bacterium]
MNFIFLKNKDKMSFLCTGGSFIDERFNLSPERMEQIKVKALKSLKEKKDNPESDTSKNDAAEQQ